MASSLTLTTFTTNLLAFLVDTTNIVFPTGTVTEAIRLALGEYSAALPLIAVGTATPAANKREVSLAALTGIIDVQEVHFPYTAADPEYPPNRVLFRTYVTASAFTLFLDSRDPPDGTQVARVFYTMTHTLSGLDSASATTYPASDDGMMMLGAAGFAALARSVEVVGAYQAEITQMTSLKAWGDEQLSQFRTELWQRKK